MKSALKYQVKISIDPVHKWGDRIIEEIFIPSISCGINEEGFAFHLTEPRKRTPLEEVQISEKDANILKQYVNLKNQMEKISRKLFDKIERK